MQIVRSEYSFLESTLKVSEIADFYAKLGLKNGLLIDKNVTHGLLEFIFACKEKNVNPIVGLEIYLQDGMEHHIIIAKNVNGYKNLLKLSSLLSLNDDYDFKLFEDLITDDVFHYTIKNHFIKAGETIDEVIYVDHYNTTDLSVVKTLKMIGHHRFLNSVSLSELATDFSQFASVSYDLNYDKFLLPTYYENNEAQERIKALTYLGAQKRYGQKLSDEVHQRIEHELKIIAEMGFNNYFLIMFDIVSFCAKNRILVGPGRGSAPSSIVAYCLGITGVDPIKHRLIFERFLNPERKTMPDIDLDIEDTRRDDVFNFLIEKYGKERAANIITFTRYGIKMALRDVARVFSYKEKQLETLISKVSSQTELGKNALEYSKGDNKLYNIALIAQKMVGLPKTTSIHAAGVIISPIPLDELTGLSKDNETIVTAYEHKMLEKIGLVKFDLLSLKNLTILQNIRTLIEHDKHIKVDFNVIPFNNKKSYELFSAGATNGIFQFENENLRKIIKKFKPYRLEDLSALTALYRPGPMQEIDNYIQRKDNQQKIDYIFDELKPVLEDTYGILVFQEQIMEVLRLIAGYSYAEADVVRRAISKKDMDLINQQRSLFISRGLENKFDEVKLNKLWQMIIRFANYGFNKSHAVSYATIAYWLMFFKANYPTYFFTAYLNSFGTQKEKLSAIVTEARILGIEVLPPSAVDGKAVFTTDGKNIKAGLLAIEQIGYKTAKVLEDNAHDLVSIWEFLKRNDKIIDERVWINLVKVGALDGLHLSRKELIEHAKNYLAYDPLYPEPLIMDKITDEYPNESMQIMEFENYGTTFTRFHGRKGQFLVLNAEQFKTDRFLISKLLTLSDCGFIECVSFERHIQISRDLEGKFVKLTGHYDLSKQTPQFVFNRMFNVQQ